MKRTYLCLPSISGLLVLLLLVSAASCGPVDADVVAQGVPISAAQQPYPGPGARPIPGKIEA